MTSRHGLARGLYMTWANRQFVNHLVCSTTLLILSISSGCKPGVEHSDHLPSSSTGIPPTSAHVEVQRVQDILAQQLAVIDDAPSDRAALLKSAKSFVAALLQADTTACPEDFRRQFDVSRRAWMANAADIRKESAYYQLHPQEDPEKGGKPGPEADKLAREKLLSLQTALLQNGKLRSLASNYGVSWK